MSTEIEQPQRRVAAEEARPADARDGAAPRPEQGRSTKPTERESPSGLIKQLGPGLITGAADDDPSGIATYSCARKKEGAWIGRERL